MLIDKTTIASFVEENLREIQNVELPTHTHSCPHCGLPVRYPIIARQEDMDAFEGLLECAQIVMDKYGITLNLLAEIQAECSVEIARRKVLRGGSE